MSDNTSYVLLTEIRDLLRQSVDLQKQTLSEIRRENIGSHPTNIVGVSEDSPAGAIYDALMSSEPDEILLQKWLDRLETLTSSMPQDNNNSDEEMD